MQDFSVHLQIALEAAKAGAKKASEYFETNIITEVKKDNTIVTIADRESEEVIKAYIRKHCPDAKFVAEESGGDLTEDTLWIIDPIDGTRSFSKGIPTWSVLIAYCKNRSVNCGVCYFPLLDLLLWAEKGKGAYVNGRKTSVSKTSQLNKAYIGFGSPKHFNDKTLMLDLIDASTSSRIYDLSLTTAFIAKGSMDALIDGYGMLWDFAPFKVIVEEAGGKTTRLDGSPWQIDNKIGAIITNGLLHDAVVSIVNGRS